MIGQQLGGYRIESVIGRGGMGIVYLAEQLRLERKVALKVITPELAHDTAFRTRFERESRLAASIDHPNVVPIYEAGEADGLLYIAMRHVRGTDLKAVLTTDGPLQPERAAAVVGQVGAALDAAHASGLVHRDVKPGNILIEPAAGGERVYLSDFGLTKRLSSASGITETGFVVGTLDYIAPEQVEGAAVDARTDVYALACVLFHSLTGRVPYARENDMAKMYAHANVPPPSLLEAAPHLPRALEDVVQRGMAKDPAARFASAGDLGRAAEAALHGQASTIAERSVATGAAAPGQSTVADTPAPGPPTAPTHPLPPLAPAQAHAPPPPAHRPPPPAHSPPPPSPPAPPPSGPSIGVIAAAIALVAIIGVAVALLATGTLGGDGDEPDTTSAASATETETETVERSTEEEPQTETSEPPPSTTTSFEPYTTQQGGFDTVVPVGDGWSEPKEIRISEGISRTRIVGPGGLEVIIDSTPGEAATFKPANRCRQTTLPTVPYAAKCVFRGGSLAPCRRARCVDYLMNAGVDGPGWGVLAGGGDFAEAERIAKRVATALTPLTGP
jgi:serine/threonine protein kinase